MKNMKFWRTALVATLVLTVMLSVTGGTIAWFTDSVTSESNNIQAGTLDVELEYYNTDSNTWVDASTGAIFDHDNWEPGYTQVRQVKLINAGTLAFKYRMNIKPNAQPAAGEANLADVIDVYVGYSEETLPTNKADLANGTKVGTISDLMKSETGAASSVMYADDKPGYMWIALHMQEEADNRYQGLSVGGGFSLVVEAAQLMHEDDSFGTDYDEDATYGSDVWTGETSDDWEQTGTPNEDGKTEYVITTAEQLADFRDEVNAGNTYEGQIIKLANNIDLNNANWEPIGNSKAPFQGTFDGQGNTVSNYKVDEENYAGLFGYVIGDVKNVTVKNADIKAGDYAGGLIGQGYADVENCHAINVTVTTTPFLLAGDTYDGGAKAGGLVGQLCEDGSSLTDCTATNVDVTAYRDLGGVAGMVNYNSTISNCSATDVSLTYLVVDNYGDGNTNQNAGNVYGRLGVNADTGATVNVDDTTKNNNGVSEITYKVGAGTFKLQSFQKNAPAKVNFIGVSKDAVIDNTWGATMQNSTVSFENVTIQGSTGYMTNDGIKFGSDYAALYSYNVTYTNCTFDRPFRIGRDGATFTNCTFNLLDSKGEAGYVWNYGNDCTFTDCTFNTAGKALLIFADGNSYVPDVKVENCKFNATKGDTATVITNQNCAAIEIDNFSAGVNLTTSGNTYSDFFSGEWRIKSYSTTGKPITVNGTSYTQTALDGDLMTVTNGEATLTN